MDITLVRRFTITKTAQTITTAPVPVEAFREVSELLGWMIHAVKRPESAMRIPAGPDGAKVIVISQIGDGPVSMTATDNFINDGEIEGLAMFALVNYWTQHHNRQQAAAMEKHAQAQAAAAMAAQLPNLRMPQRR